jgi:hypothetical protein
MVNRVAVFPVCGFPGFPEQDLGLVQAGDAFNADAQEMQRGLQQFKAIQHATHP